MGSGDSKGEYNHDKNSLQIQPLWELKSTIKLKTSTIVVVTNASNTMSMVLMTTELVGECS